MWLLVSITWSEQKVQSPLGL